MNHQNQKKRNTGFTLIELLVVVAIISILSGIAVSNYLMAATRSKVARVQMDIRTMMSALELYRLDEASYPPAALGDYQIEFPLVPLTTPVAQLTTIPSDPFGMAKLDINPDVSFRGYNYKDRKTTSKGMPAETYSHIWKEMSNKDYFIHSSGPNRVWDVYPYTEYDPTNGTLSAGDICRFGPM